MAGDVAGVGEPGVDLAPVVDPDDPGEHGHPAISMLPTKSSAAGPRPDQQGDVA